MNRKERHELIGKCLDRYGHVEDRLSRFMDLDYSGVDVERLLSFPDADFYHDMNGIFVHMDRETCRLGDCFVPRAGLVKN